MLGNPAHADFVAQIANRNGWDVHLAQLCPEQVGFGFQRGNVLAARVMIDPKLVRAGSLDRNRRGGRAVGKQGLDGSRSLRSNPSGS